MRAPHKLREKTMPRGYWIVRMDVSNPDDYKQYVAANAKPFRRFGARFLVRGGAAECVEGGARARNVVLEFPSLEAAQQCYADPAYQDAKALRANASIGDIVIVEGYDGPQPGD